VDNVNESAITAIKIATKHVPTIAPKIVTHCPSIDIGTVAGSMPKIRANEKTTHCQKYIPAGWHRSGSITLDASLQLGILISNWVNVYDMTKTKVNRKPRITLNGFNVNNALVTKKLLKGTRLIAPINLTLCVICGNHMIFEGRGRKLICKKKCFRK